MTVRRLVPQLCRQIPFCLTTAPGLNPALCAASMSDKHLVELSRRQRLGSIFWSTVSLLLGWTLYVYWWSKVLSQEQPREVIVLLLLIVLSSMVLLALVLAWIWHNRRLARRGVRGSTSRFK